MKFTVKIENGKKYVITKTGEFAPLTVKRGAGVNVNANGVITADVANVCVDSIKGHTCKVTMYKIDKFERENLNVLDFFAE